MLTKRKGLPLTQHANIWSKKQQLTLEALSNLKPDPLIKKTISRLSQEGYKIACCSNSIRKSVLTMLSKLDLIEYMDLILSNEDVKNSKPRLIVTGKLQQAIL